MSDAPTEPAPETSANVERVVYTRSEPKTVPAVFGAICEAMNAIGAVGKERRSDHGNFQFRGIDDILNAVGPVMRDHCLFVNPRLLTIERTPAKSKNGGGLMNTIVTVEFEFVSGADGSTYTVGPIPGEAMDSGDKSTAKAMSVALRTCLIQVFAIPTEDRDPDDDVYERAHQDNPAPAASAPQVRARRARSGDYESDPWADDNPERAEYYRGAIRASSTEDALKLVWNEVVAECNSGALSNKDGSHLSSLIKRRITEIQRERAAAAAADPEAEFRAA